MQAMLAGQREQRPHLGQLAHHLCTRLCSGTKPLPGLLGLPTTSLVELASSDALPYTAWPACLQVVGLLADVQRPAEEEGDVERIKEAIAAVEAAAPGAAASCSELAERCRARWSFVVPPDEAALQAELAVISEVLAAWEGLLGAATARGQEDIQLPRLDHTASTASELAGGESSSMSKKRRSAKNSLARTASTASTASSSSSKARKGSSKRAPSRQQQAAPPSAGKSSG